MLHTQQNHIATYDDNPIMRHIQNQIQAATASNQHHTSRNAKLSYPNKPFDIPYNLSLYQHLAATKSTYLNYNRDLQINQNSLTKIPLLGRVFRTIQVRLHQIALFYTNRALHHQLEVNRLLLESMEQLTTEFQEQQRIISQLQKQQ